MKKYQVCLHGCDDSTYIEMELTTEQLEFMKKLEVLAEKNSDYVCQPTIEIKELKEENS